MHLHVLLEEQALLVEDISDCSYAEGGDAGDGGEGADPVVAGLASGWTPPEQADLADDGSEVRLLADGFHYYLLLVCFLYVGGFGFSP